jgi:hypothetical protein
VEILCHGLWCEQNRETMALRACEGRSQLEGRSAALGKESVVGGLYRRRNGMHVE